MRVFGGILFIVGILFLIMFGVVGFNGVGNLPGLFIGTACMISGSVILGFSLIVDANSGKNVETNTVQVSKSDSDNNRSSFLDDGDTPSDYPLLTRTTVVVFGVLVLIFLALIFFQ